MSVMRAAAFGLWMALQFIGAHPVEGQDAPTILYVVRHAERADDGTPDPPLSGPGLQRASQLARMLADSDLTAVYSTDLKRTRQTAGPAAERFGLVVDTYDPRQLEHFAGELASNSGGRILVTGHSNTTPALVELLGGDPVSAIDEAEYDRLYIVVVGAGRAATSVLLRFGAPFETQ